MKILILTAATGGGHIKSANTIKTYFNENTDYEVETLDTLKAVSRIIDKIICDSYLFMARKAPFLFGSLYKHTNQDTRFAQLVPKLNALLSHYLLYEIRDFNPDIIIATHHVPAQMVSALKEKSGVTASLLCLITDYGPHRAWIAPYVDHYIVACEDMIAELTELGIPNQRVHAYGIPVNREFFGSYDKASLRENLGLDPNLPTVTFMAGSFGVTNIIDLYKEIVLCGTPMQLVVITGKNQKLYDTFQEVLSQGTPVPTKLVFFTNEVENYMHASDLLVTKPGGLTVSEALASSLPLVMFDAIPGQEEDNANFLSRHGMGIRIGKGENLVDVVKRLLDNPDELAELKKNCAAFDKSKCLDEISALCASLPAAALDSKAERVS